MTAGPAVGQLILVDDELTLGSAAEGEGALAGDNSLSASHALVSCDHTGDWMVRDLGSATGTFLNGRELSAIESLYRGDTLKLGDSKLLVLDGPMREPHAGIVIPAPINPPPPPPPPPADSFGAAESEEAPPVEPPPPPAYPAPERPKHTVASDARRVGAALIDAVIASAIAVAIVLALGAALFSTFVALAVVLAWDFLFESLRGQTIGKRVMKIRVVRRDGSRLRPQHVSARNVLRIVDGLPGFPLVGLLSMTISGRSRRQRVGDLAAGTFVVNSERMMSRLPQGRDRLVLFAYPVAWLVPVLVWAFMTPGATTKVCRTSWVSAHPPEGTCVTAAPGTGQKVLLTAVNPGHTLHWEGWDVRVRAARAHQLHQTPGLSVVAYKLSLTNTSNRPEVFGPRTVAMVLNIPAGGGAVRVARSLPASLHLRGFRPLQSRRPIAAGATRTGWARFGVQSAHVGLLEGTLASMSLFPADAASSSLPRLGNLRLWNPATPGGANAVHLRAA